ncbi:polysaccharide deacetylase [Alicyclobacillus cycloheptanicus]|uniref:Peptidoglycan/xylan/chitin deacetylase (PgdA/CDA1 family) n=1 Tax=Alicyclobacillus cycloheptanicus TaxID=1457 RepID=A0ABT9XHV7_9BACL|nr:polysaccharide deacetylase [Alicyclobacillus cycloheptanicus]MDQ0189363.1 peptidoglycan/xylan/chitin deacetylase (PgdA/CDA1 family) [Alicyclobacillus cycloheptanicus]WDM01284.1 polysaccharide deacetylase [Alicyclobacillus cycloheptanicus]
MENKGTVCLSFDFDAMSLWMSRGLFTPTPISRGEFGVVAVPRILYLLEERGIKSTWFIPGHTIETYRSVCEEIVAAGHEVALHTYNHTNMDKLTEQEEAEMFRRSYDLVANLTGIQPKGFRGPGFDQSPRTIDFMTNLGLLYDSSQMGHDYALYYCRQGDVIYPNDPPQLGPNSTIVEMPISWSLDDYPHFEYFRTQSIVMPGLREVDSVFKNWTADLEYMIRDFEDGVCTITFHPQVIGRGHRLLGLERWLDQLADMGLTFERMDIVAEAFAGGREFGIYQPKGKGREARD